MVSLISRTTSVLNFYAASLRNLVSLVLHKIKTHTRTAKTSALIVKISLPRQQLRDSFHSPSIVTFVNPSVSILLVVCLIYNSAHLKSYLFNWRHLDWNQYRLGHPDFWFSMVSKIIKKQNPSLKQAPFPIRKNRQNKNKTHNKMKSLDCNIQNLGILTKKLSTWKQAAMNFHIVWICSSYPACSLLR